MLICKYKFDKRIHLNPLPTFNDGFTYTVTDAPVGNIVTRTIESDSMPTRIWFGHPSGGEVANHDYTGPGLAIIEILELNLNNLTIYDAMFSYCKNLTTICDITIPDSVTTIYRMFHYCTSLTSVKVSSSATNKVTSMSNMFQQCHNLTSLDLSNFNTQNATSMSSMFNNCTSLTSLDLSSFNTQNVTNMSTMFQNCSSLTSLDLSNFNTQSVTNMAQMFYGCSSLTSLDLSSFNTEKVENTSNMFTGCTGLTSLNLSNWNTSNVTNMNSMFYGCSTLTNLNLSSFNTQNVSNMSYMFTDCTSLTSLDLSSFNTQNIASISYMFSNCSSLTSLNVSNFNTEKVASMSNMFNNCLSLTSLNVSNFNTEKVTTMANMFTNCESLTSLNVSNFNTQNVTTMNRMFYNCNKLTSLNVSSFNTEKVENMTSMFQGCSSLTSLDVSSFNTQNVTTMQSMFYNCRSLTSLNISHFNTQKVENMNSMFYNCNNLTSLDLSNWNTENVINVEGMFSTCSSLTSLDLSNWNTDKVTSASAMFGLCSSIERITGLESLDFPVVISINSMFSNCSKLKEIKMPRLCSKDLRNCYYFATKCAELEEVDLSSLTFNKAYDTGYMFTDCPNLRFIDLSNASITEAAVERSIINTANPIEIGALYWTEYAINYFLRNNVHALNTTLWVQDVDAESIENTAGVVTIKNYKESSRDLKLPAQLKSNGEVADRLYWDTDRYYIEQHIDPNTGEVLSSPNIIETAEINQIAVRTFNPEYKVYLDDNVGAKSFKAIIPYFEVDESYEYDPADELEYIKQSFELRYPDADDVAEDWGYMGVGEEGTGLKALIDWVNTAGDEEFVEDFDKHFHRDYTLRYYLLVITLGMVDNLGKNMMLDTWDNKIFMPRFYDCDTICSYDNSGDIKFDVDIEMAQGYWNTSSSVLWTRIRDLMHDELAEKYQDMRANGLSYEGLMKCFYDEQIAKIPQRYYNFDADVKYLPFANQYLGMAHGDGYEHLKRWLKKRIQFTDSLYDYAPSYNNDVLTIRANTTNEMEITIETYNPVYQHMSWYNGQMDKKKISGNKVTFKGRAMAATDQEVLIYGGSNIKRITGITSMNPDELIIGAATKLVELEVIDCPLLTDINKNKANLSEHIYLNKLVINDCPNLGGTLRLNNAEVIQEIDMKGTKITDIQLAPSVSNLRSIKLPNTITSLTTLNAESLHTIEFESGAKIEYINLQNCNNLVNAVNFDVKEAAEVILDNSFNNIKEWYFSNAINLTLRNLAELERVIFTPNDEYEVFNKEYLATRPDYKVTTFNLPKCNEFLVTAPQRLSYGLEDEKINPNTVFSANSLDLTDTYFTDVKLLSTVDVNSLKLPSTMKNFIADSAYDIDTNVIEDAHYEVTHEELIQQYTEEWNEEVEISRVTIDSIPVIRGDFNTVYPSINWGNCYTDKLYIKGDYSVELNGHEWFAVYGFDVDDTVIWTNRATSTTDTQACKGTIPTNVAYVRFSCYGSTDLKLQYSKYFTPDIVPSSSDGSVIYSINSEQEGVWNLDGLELDNFYTYGMNNDIKDLSKQYKVDYYLSTGPSSNYILGLIPIEWIGSNNFNITSSINNTIIINLFDVDREYSGYLSAMNSSDVTVDCAYIGLAINDLNEAFIINGNSIYAGELTDYRAESVPRCLFTSIVMPKKDANYKVTIENANIEPKELPTMLYPKFINTESPIKGEVDYSAYEGTSLDYAAAYMNKDEVELTIPDNVMLNTTSQYNMNKDSEYDIRDPRTICVLTYGAKGQSPALYKNGVFTDYTRAEVDNGDGTYTVTIMANNIDNMPNQLAAGSTSIVSVEYINTKGYTNMANMFQNCSSLVTVNCRNWDTSNVTNMNGMFQNCISLTELDISNWKVENVTSMYNLFASCSKLVSLDLSSWNTQSVTNIGGMFRDCLRLTNLNLSNFNTQSVTSMSNMFLNCSSLTSLNLSNFNTQKVENMTGMFGYCSGLTSLNLSNWKTENVTTMRNMFQNCTKLTSVNVSGWNTIKLTDPSLIFRDCTALTSIQGIKDWNTSNVLYMNEMFYGCSKLTSLDLSGWNTQNVETMANMFQGCSSLTSLNVSSFNTQNVTSMSGMFYNCTSLTSLNISNFNTENVTSMNAMFQNCSKLTSLNLSSFNTQKVTTIGSMFYGCSKLTSLDLSNFDTQGVTSISYMFQGCSSLTSLNLSNWNTQSVISMNNMFNGCSSLTSLDLSSFNTQKVTNMTYMFSSCSSLTSLNLSNFNTQNVTDAVGMLSNCSSLNYVDITGWVVSDITQVMLATLLAHNDGKEYIVRGSGMFTLPQGWTLQNPNIILVYTSKSTSIASFYSQNNRPWTEYSSSTIDNGDGTYTITICANDLNNLPARVSLSYAIKIDMLVPTMLSSGYEMFKNNYALEGVIDVSNIVTSKFTSTADMFVGCWYIEGFIGLDTWDTSNVTNMSYMFSNIIRLTTLTGIEDWDVRKVTSFQQMFFMSPITSLDLRNWEIGSSNVVMSSMFSDTSLVSLDISTWNMSGVINCNNMFANAKKLVTLNPPILYRSIDFSSCTALSVESLLSIIANLASVTTAQTLTLGATNLAKLTEEQIAQAVTKGWTVE